MVQTVCIPEKALVDISIHLPDDYIGKEVHVIFYTEEELANVTVLPKRKPSDYFGTLSIEEGEKFQQYITHTRNEQS